MRIFQMPSYARNWVFTLNNYSDDEAAALEALGTELPDTLKYLVYGRETGEEGTPHLQGYASFSKRTTLARVKRIVGSRAHVEVARGTPKQASDYCKKDGDFKEYGTCPAGKGARTDLQQVVEACKRGDSLKRLAEDHPAAMLRYGSQLVKMKGLYPPQKDICPEIHCFIGKTGVGKTRRVYEFVNRDELWVHPGERWFDGYDMHKAALFDDFDGGWFKITYLLKLLDRYRMQVPVKHGFVWWNPAHIYITSNLKPEDWYPNAHEEHRRALRRRLTEFGKILVVE